MHNILIVDDEYSIRESFSLILEGTHKILLAASGEVALKTIADQKVDMAFLDIRMPGMNGLETLKRIKEIDPDIEVVMVTAVNDVQKASEAIKLGARDYVIKPFDVDHITKLAQQILRKKSIQQQSEKIQNIAGLKLPELIGPGEKILAVIKSLGEIKDHERVLISGETGTEKETIAQIIHAKSSQSTLPYQATQLSSLMTPARIKALLFGWGKGESTVALDAKSGLIEQVKGGTLFIDNIETLPAEIFKTISSLEFSRSDDSTKIPLKARLICGSSSNLESTMQAFFAQAHIQVPALRERNSDIPFLINHFVEQYGTQYGQDTRISTEALKALNSYTWPGNTQQLASVIKRLVLCSSTGKVDVDDLPLDILLKTSEAAGSNFISAFEKEYIRATYKKCGKNKEKAANLLEINPYLLETKL
ncbi:hypothetical protein A3H38_05695 [candidate division WOR-1 bacterium RIFCSPLOWO2_02_FULL_46_20]|uniref:Sigma-54-dependent Fis family transcriptional regulator n=2 Tax=Saganbacteria TaxID=1703751 RepID=A0A1F4RBC9_UNCSA|nr:MAG: hypothetical protein A3J44_04995 [candidate division WOR-1 bacterium RIFCSPHIGHO2_02_FULL_45_12]OGC05460.1 MAG: hypothetical protein A3H38_05695 [candidate division WOR-1 bacterium RIFCSPLOWO2_02_FULL_46_20]OGC09091.1 MAG: hypothetical protein A3F86_01835 [candidate division WOR-1 bacterium RIFCSPLOWO2_12_FULL_45_9]